LHDKSLAAIRTFGLPPEELVFHGKTGIAFVAFSEDFHGGIYENERYAISS
jgi:hypothetical protein